MENGFQLNPQDRESIEPLLRVIRAKHGESLMAIIVYGSWLRGKRDTMLDFYVLVEDHRTLGSVWQGIMCRLLPPNVYQISHKPDAGAGGEESRAKYALLTLDQFCRALRHDFHSYFWARFAQPCKVAFARDDKIREQLSESFTQAVATFMRHVLPLMPERFSSRDLWTTGLSNTYRCELRTEGKNRPQSIYDFDPAYYDRVTLAAAVSGAGLEASENGAAFVNRSTSTARRFAPLKWWLRRLQGRVLSLLRLMKAALTFNDPLQYLLWKIERHTGIYIEPTERQLRYPLVFAWPLLWRLYRRGAFR